MCELSWIDGKQKADVKLSWGDKFNYSARDVEAFRGQEIRADVEKALAAAGVEVTTDIVDKIVGVLSRGF